MMLLLMGREEEEEDVVVGVVAEAEAGAGGCKMLTLVYFSKILRNFFYVFLPSQERRCRQRR